MQWRHAGLLAVMAAFFLFFSNSKLTGATVSWVGGSGDWTSTGHWSTGALPGPADDVVINPAGSVTVTHSTGNHTVSSLLSTKAFVLSGGELAVFHSFIASNTVTLSGGTLSTTMMVTTNGTSLIVDGTGTLSGVTVDGILDVGNSAGGALLTVTNGLALNGTALVGNPTNNYYGSIRFAGSQMLSGVGKVVFGNNCCNNALWLTRLSILGR